MAFRVNNQQLGPYDSVPFAVVDLLIPQGFWNRLYKDYPEKPTNDRPLYGQLWPRGIHQAMVGAEILQARIEGYGASRAFAAAPTFQDFTISSVDVSRAFVFANLESPAGWTWSFDLLNATTVRVTLNEGGGSSASLSWTVVELPYGA